METIKTKSEIFLQRLLIAVLCSSCLQVCLAIFLVFIIQIDVFHPSSWLSSALEEIFGIKILMNILLLILVSVVQAVVYGKYHLIKFPHYTRFSRLSQMFTLPNLIFVNLYAVSGYFSMSLYSSLANSSFYTIKKSCQSSDGQCIVETSVFLQFGGMWMGMYYYFTSHIMGTSILTFPHIYQNKLHQMKQAIASIVINGFHNAILPTVYYCGIYVYCGNKPRGLVSDVYSLYLEDERLDNIFTLIKSKIWVSVWFYIGLYFISMNIMKNVFNIILTQPMQFPIESDRTLTLSAALGQKEPINEALAAQDLKCLSMTDFHRRQQIFTLSQPGGHPHNWNNILEKSLIIINEFSTNLETITSDPKVVQTKSANNDTRSLPAHKNIRNLAKSPTKYDNVHMSGNTQTNRKPIGDVLREQRKEILNKLRQNTGVSFLFSELLEIKLKVTLIKAQPVIWTCEGLAHLAAASLTEDQYGAVQYDLPIIISTLVELKQNLDKITKPGLVTRKQLLNDPMAIKMKSALVSAVKRSIYKITITFSKYINDIPLSPEVQTAIQPFLLFKEA